MMAVGARSGPHGHDDVRPEQADQPDDPAQRVLVAPHVEGCLVAQRVEEIGLVQEVDQVHTVLGGGPADLGLAKNAQRGAELPADGVAAALAPRDEHDARLCAAVEDFAGEGGRDPAFVIGMGAHIEQVYFEQVVGSHLIYGLCGDRSGQQQGKEDQAEPSSRGEASATHHFKSHRREGSDPGDEADPLQTMVGYAPVGPRSQWDLDTSRSSSLSRVLAEEPRMGLISGPSVYIIIYYNTICICERSRFA